MVNPQLQVLLPFFGAFKKFICGVFWCFTTWHTEQAKTGSRVASKCIWFSEQPWRSFAAQELDVALCHRTIPWVPRCRFEQSTRWSMMSWAIDLWGVQGVLKLRSVRELGAFWPLWGAKVWNIPRFVSSDKVFLWGSLRSRKGFSSKWRTKQHREILQVTSKAGIWKVSVPQKGDNRLEILTRTLNVYNFVTESFCSQCSCDLWGTQDLLSSFVDLWSWHWWWHCALFSGGPHWGSNPALVEISRLWGHADFGAGFF